ncbi:metal-dependent hydrolase [candidate division CSSED10-310 bacterium]|uniref:Metal-dependent hydrolase n=1 Tax=candidate division CSSED10-310 bacterium TaxID=2855610 RepID=A0ABV6Z6M8_UNCC1
MPGYKGHIGGGVVSGVVIAVVLVGLSIIRPDHLTLLFLGVVTLLGALFPDVDTDSKAQNLFYSCVLIVDLILMLKGLFRSAAMLGFVALLPAIGHHRGWTHTWWAMLLVPAPIIVLPLLVWGELEYGFIPYYLAAVTGYLSHLVLDRTF